MAAVLSLFLPAAPAGMAHGEKAGWMGCWRVGRSRAISLALALLVGLPSWSPAGLGITPAIASPRPGAAENDHPDPLTGLGSPNDVLTPAALPNVRSSLRDDRWPIAVGPRHVLIVATDGALLSWGAGEAGQLGTSTVPSRLIPQPILAPDAVVAGRTTLPGVPPLAASAWPVEALAAGTSHSVAAGDGLLFGFGANSAGQLGSSGGDTVTPRLTTLPQPAPVGGVRQPRLPPDGAPASSVLPGALWSWGSNSYGQLGNATFTDSTRPVPVRGPNCAPGGLADVKAVAGGMSFSLALRRDGTVWAWGDNSLGQLGDDTFLNRPCPVQVHEGSGYLTGVTAIAAGGRYGMALKADGTVRTWGTGYWGELGDGLTQHARAMTVTSAAGTPITNVVAIASGGSHDLALRGDGTVLGWGYNGAGQVGIGGTADQAFPVVIPTFSGVYGITAGSWTSGAVKTDCSVWTWGYNANGQLGRSTAPASYADTPGQLSAPCTSPYTIADVPQVAMDNWEGFAVSALDGGVWAWGANAFGQLGLGHAGSVPTPNRVAGIGGSGYLNSPALGRAGNGFTVGLLPSGEAYAMGRNDYGELGQGATGSAISVATLVAQPVAASGARLRFSGLSGGFHHTVAIERDLPMEPAVAGDQSAYGLPLLNSALGPGGVSTYNGALLLAVTDHAIAGQSPSPALVRSYNSRSYRTGALGQGWQHSYEMRLRRAEDGTADILVIGTQGREDPFTYDPMTGLYVAPPGLTSRLTRNADGTYTVIRQDQATRIFDAAGRMITIADRYGATSTLTYDTTGRLTSVSDPAGRGSLSFSYNGNGLLSRVSDWAGRFTDYTYAPDYLGYWYLLQVRDRGDAWTTYSYAPSDYVYGFFRITQIDRPRAITATGVAAAIYSYGNGAVTSVLDPGEPGTGDDATVTYSFIDQNGARYGIVGLPPASFPGSDPSFQPSFVDMYGPQADGRQVLLRREAAPDSDSPASVETLTYDSSGFIRTTTNPLGQVTTTCYDVGTNGMPLTSRGNLTRIIGPRPTAGAPQPVTLLTYDSLNQIVLSIPPAGVTNTAAETIGCANDLTSKTLAAHATTMTYGGVSYDSAPRYLQSTTRYATDGGVLRAETTYFDYGSAANRGLPTTVTSPRGFPTTTSYSAGLPAIITDAYGGQSVTVYDTVGRPIEQRAQDNAGNVQQKTTAAYDDLDRLRFSYRHSTTGGSPLRSESRYDPAGNRTITIDPMDQLVRFSYNGRNQLVAVEDSPDVWTNPASPPSTVYLTTYAYDKHGNQIEERRLAGSTPNNGLDGDRVLTKRYDGFGRLRAETQHPNGPANGGQLVSTFGYDVQSHPTTWTQPDGLVTTVGYDALGRPVTVSYSDGVTANSSATYDRNGNRLSLTDGTGTTTYGYDEQNRLVWVEQPSAGRIEYRYNADGARSAITYPGSWTVNYGYDSLGRLRTLKTPNGHGTPDGLTTTFWANWDSTPQKVDLPNGTTTFTGYDGYRRPVSVSTTRANPLDPTISSVLATLDARGNRTKVDSLLHEKDSLGTGLLTRTRYYSYDQLSRLVFEAPDTGTTNRSCFGYDRFGNRTRATPPGQCETTDPTVNLRTDQADRVLNAGDYTYSFDGRGNVTSRDLVFRWDGANRLTKVRQVSPSEYAFDKATYRYNGDGDRVGKTTWAYGGADAVNTTYVLDVSGDLPYVLDDGSYRYVWAQGRLLYSVKKNSGGLLVAHSDLQGTLISQTDATAQVVTVYRNTSYGAVAIADDDGIARYDDPADQVFRYTGEQYDRESGLTYLRARYMDPSSGRFMSRDMFGGYATNPQSKNRYSYAENNPANRQDPSGQTAVGACVGGSVSVAAGAEAYGCVVHVIEENKTAVLPSVGFIACLPVCFGAGIYGLISNAEKVSDFYGPFVVVGGGITVLLGIEGELAIGTVREKDASGNDIERRVWVFTGRFKTGAELALYGGFTNTFETPLVVDWNRIAEQFTDVIGEIDKKIEQLYEPPVRIP